jgi:hypothetical protein
MTNSAIDQIIAHLDTDLTATEGTIRSHAKAIIVDMERVIEWLDQGYHLNDRGEIGRNGLDLDLLVSRREQLIAERTRLGSLRES